LDLKIVKEISFRFRKTYTQWRIGCLAEKRAGKRQRYVQIDGGIECIGCQARYDIGFWYKPA
jgi:hypothetical protein